MLPSLCCEDNYFFSSVACIVSGLSVPQLKQSPTLHSISSS